MTEVAIRAMTPGDVDAVTSMVISSQREGAHGHYTDIEIEAFARTISATGLADRPLRAHQRVAVLRDEIVGTAGWVGYGDGGARLTLIFVSPAHFGEGIGRMLVMAVEDDATAAGAIALVVRSSLNAVGFYERLGYEVVERWSTQLDTLEMDSMLMRKADST